MRLSVLRPDKYIIFLKIGVYILLLNIAVANDDKTNQKKDPKKAFYFSLIPGMGQAYNGKWLKSAMIIAIEASAISAWSNNLESYNNYDSSLPLNRNRYLEKRNKYAWWIGIIYVYSMIDAVVDAHLNSFDTLMNSSLDKENNEGGVYEK